MVEMTSLLALGSPVHVFRGCRSYQRPGVAIGSKINIEAFEQYLPSHSTKDQMQTPSSPVSGVTAAECIQGDITTSWRSFPNTRGSSEDTRLVMMFATRGGRGRRNTMVGDAQTPFFFVPCQLDISTCESLSEQLGLSSSGHEKLECVGLPGDFVRWILSGTLPVWDGIRVQDGLGAAHFDDGDPWVFSRCILDDFSGMGSEEAAFLSRERRLGCWASVTLTRQAGGGWDLGFLIHRLVVSGDH